MLCGFKGQIAEPYRYDTAKESVSRWRVCDSLFLMAALLRHYCPILTADVCFSKATPAIILLVFALRDGIVYVVSFVLKGKCILVVNVLRIVDT